MVEKVLLLPWKSSHGCWMGNFCQLGGIEQLIMWSWGEEGTPGLPAEAADGCLEQLPFGDTLIFGLEGRAPRKGKVICGTTEAQMGWGACSV